MKALKISSIVFVLVITGVLAFLMISAMKAPDTFMQDFRNETAKLAKNKDILSYPDELLEKKTSLDARLAMSDDDSIGIRISLKDKALYLEIQGIVLHKTPIKELKTSSFFKHLSAQERYVLFSRPLAIQKDESTIEKDTWIITYAPKDTIEAAARAEIIPDTILKEPVMYRLYLEHGIRIQVTGELADTVEQFWPRMKFEYGDRINFLKALAKNVTKKTPLPYNPTVSILIDAKEAEAIYRAVPKNGFVILEL